MKILRVVSDLYPAVVGGIEIHAHEMSKEQARLGHNVTVYTSNIDGKPTQESKDGYKIIRLKPILKLIGNTFMPMLLLKLIYTRNDFDVIHAHSHLFFSTNVCALVRRLGSPPLIITNHGIMSASAPDWFNMLYMKTIGKWTLKSADMIICYTQMEKNKLEDMLKIDSKKIRVIPNGVNTDLFHPDTAKHSNPNNAITILWVGRFVRGKGVNFIIHAAKILLREVPDLKILLIGDGQSKDKIKSLI
jgi:glycosyltransferase involved in cell wall biosynthesis